jgi:GT2 family glycosyltransferase/glycosyltransferase involved in cell wall biosynthesis
MKRFLAGAWRLLRGLPLALLSPILLTLAAVAMLLCDLLSRLKPRRRLPQDTAPDTRAASVVIPNWNGRDLLDKYLPSVIAALSDSAQNEIIVVDNGSEDGSADFLLGHFPQVRVLALERNLGFGGGSNAGFRAARNDIVVLLNSDMRVERNFLQPLLDGFKQDGFDDDKTFAVSCQIFFSDPAKLREETGLTEGWWSQGGLRVRHRTEPGLRQLYPCFYGGGGSCAFDRRKFLELGGFDELLKPFYLEDTDLGYLAWKRGWKVVYQPASVVYHEHRGTIGKRFSETYIQAVLKKNFLLFTWKNIHDWRWMSSHIFFTWAGATLSWLAGDSPERPSFSAILRACLALPRAMVSRSRARALAMVSDREAFRRPQGGHYRDTFLPLRPDPPRLAVLFVSPYPICPPVHGGGVFMYQTVRELARLSDLHLVVLLDHEREREAHAELDRICASTEYVVRMTGRQKALGSPEPHAPREFRNRDLAWLIHRQIYTHSIDVLQLEYLVMGQYAGQFRHIPSILFEHDVYFQAIARRLPYMSGVLERTVSRWEYLRAIRYELKLLPRLDRVQVCSRDNAEYLRSFLPQLNGRVDDGYRAGIDTSGYEFRPSGREPFTLLFLGSFRHLPNVEALQWFLQEVFPRIRKEEPRARLVIVGSDPPPRHSLRDSDAIEMIGFVEDVREPLMRYSLFVCPILAGSGVRVKLLEAFAAGIPVVSTRMGAEGLADQDGEICALADDPAAFAGHVVHLLRNPGEAEELARRARAEVVAKRDMRAMTGRLMECYRTEVGRMRQDKSEAAAEKLWSQVS